MFKNKKLRLAILVAVVVSMLVASVAYADPAILWIHSDGCMVIDLNGLLVEVEGTPAGDGPIVVTQSNNGNWHISCRGSLPASSPRPDHAVVWKPEGFWCGHPDYTSIPTSDLSLVFTPSGHVTLNCYFGPR